MSDIVTSNRTTTIDLRRTGRIAGLWYLALAIFGIAGFLLIRPRIYAAGDPAATLANLIDHAPLARMGLFVELGLVVSQALAAVWFYKLFRSINATAAWAVAGFGLVNAIAIMASAGFMATASAVANDVGLAPGGDTAATVQLMYQLSSDFWGVGALFFGLWLIPMGYVTTRSQRMPSWLGRILILGGAGYVLSVFVGYGIAAAPTWLVDALTFPATVGEFWMIGHLLIRGFRLREDTGTPAIDPRVTVDADR